MTISAEVESLIADAPLSAHLATAVDDRPHVAPVWYGYRDSVLYFITGGRKLENARRNPRVAVSIEKANGGDVEWNVLLRGTATVSDDPDRIEWASGWIYEAYDIEADDDQAPDDGSTPDGETEETDGGSDSNARREAALIEVEIGSSSATIYD